MKLYDMAFAGHKKAVQLSSRNNENNRNLQLSKSAPIRATEQFESPLSPSESNTSYSTNSDHSEHISDVPRSRSRAGDNNTQAPQTNGAKDTTHPRPDDEEKLRPRDDKGNLPSASIWVGNTPSMISENEVAHKFSLHGPIKSIKVSRGRYVFVNYCETRSAIRAFNSWHNRKVFSDQDMIYIRFTAPPEAEKRAKQSFREFERDNFPDDSIKSSKSQQRPSLSIPKHSNDSTQWPNGRPPTGPKSQSLDISPPPLRRNDRKYDTYRPSRQDSQDWIEDVDDRWQTIPTSKGHNSGQSDRLNDRDNVTKAHLQTSHEYRNGDVDQRDVHRTIQDKTNQASILADAGSLSGVRIRGMAGADREFSPTSYSIEKADATNKDASIPGNFATEGFVSKCKISNESQVAFEVASTLNNGMILESATFNTDSMQDNSGSYSPPDILTTIDMDNEMFIPRTDNAHVTKKEDGKGFVHLSALYHSKSVEDTTNLSTLQIESPRERARTSNTPLSDFTSSSKSSSLRKKCADCRKPETSLMPLIPCTHCPKRFHSTCGDPRPLVNEKANFVCGRCLQKSESAISKHMNTNSTATVPTDTETSPTTVFVAEVKEVNIPVLDIPQQRKLSTQHGRPNNCTSIDGNNGGTAIDSIPDTHTSATNSSVNEESSLVPVSTSRLERITTLESNITTASAHKTSSENTATISRALDKGSNSTTAFGINKKSDAPATEQQNPQIMQLKLSHLVEHPGVMEEASRTAAKYKQVTCPWWRDGDSCIRGETDCMFAHELRSIDSPNGFSRAKEWTCPAWQTARGCLSNPDKCLYSHSDTGFYIGLDGKALKKHLTCFWWYHNGQCKKPENRCLYSHRWTGMVAEEPSTKPTRRMTDNYPKERVKALSAPTAQNQQPIHPHSSLDASFCDLSASLSTRMPVDLTPCANLDSAAIGPPQVMSVTTSTRPETLSPRNPDQPGDPRISKKVQHSSQLCYSPIQQDGASISSSIRDSTTDTQQQSSNFMLPPNVRRLSTNQCARCGRKVFKMDLCTSCQRSAGQSSNEKVTNASSTLSNSIAENTMRKVHLQPVAQPVAQSIDGALDQEIMNEFGDDDAMDSIAYNSWTRKRKASDSNMFPYSKKQKPDLKIARLKDAQPNMESKEPSLLASNPLPPAFNRASEPDLQPAVEDVEDAQRSSSPSNSLSMTASKLEPMLIDQDLTEDATRKLSESPRQDYEITSPAASDFVESLHEAQDLYSSSDAESDRPLASIRARSAPFPTRESIVEKMWSDATSISQLASRFIDGGEDNVTNAENTESLLSAAQRAPNCDECRRRKRKCLHDERGNFDGQKCFEWLESQRDTGLQKLYRRSEKEAQAIKAVAMKYKARCDFQQLAPLENPDDQHIADMSQKLKAVLPTPSTTIATTSLDGDPYLENTTLSVTQEANALLSRFESTVPEALVTLKPRELCFTNSQTMQVLQIENKSKSMYLAFHLTLLGSFASSVQFSQSSEIIPPRMTWPIKFRLQHSAISRLWDVKDLRVYLKYAFLASDGIDVDIESLLRQFSSGMYIPIWFSNHSIPITPDTDDDGGTDELASTGEETLISNNVRRLSSQEFLLGVPNSRSNLHLSTTRRYSKSLEQPMDERRTSTFTATQTERDTTAQYPHQKPRLKLNVGEKSKIRELHRTRQSSFDPISPVPENRSEDSSDRITASMARLKKRGVVFEEPDSGDESEIGFTNQPEGLTEVSGNIGSVDHLQTEKSIANATDEGLYLKKITKGQGLKEPWRVRQRQMIRNLQVNGNPHIEVIRQLKRPIVSALVERKVSSLRMYGDAWTSDEITVREEQLTYQEFLGIAKDTEVEPCLIGQGPNAQLAFREKRQDVSLLSKKKRVNDNEKWPVSDR